ncbi:hypothetical protein F0Q45_21970 [Mycobacterium simiae]|uniref:Uncharacterized protein n=1 Tax=Mycobacterium simiae TaxID=1784 RepID=A0A5B1BHR5_MYCSI|nr:hypothetical protein [Mycobacterium simiae]KAA1248197.1 hypothetical protein F0Q45_21970 [Mycobacterium simiae]
MTGGYWDELPDDQRALLSKLAWRYLRRRTIPDHETACELLAWQQLDIEITDAHGRWLEKVKAEVEQSGQQWTHANMLRYCEGIE